MPFRAFAGVLVVGGVLLATSPLCAQDQDAGRALAKRVAAACGVDNWGEVSSLRFTFRVLPGPKDRTHAWDAATGTVKVTIAGKTTEVPAAGWAPGAKPTAAQLAAHKAWVNDFFWYTAGLHMAWDQVAGFDDLGSVDVPQLAKLGKRRALRVRYGPKGGYTPGDHYVLYLGDDDRPVAWAFHKAGAKVPKLVTTWERYMTMGGAVTLPTRFARPDGSVLIGIEGISVGTRKAPPTSRPTSRPTAPDTQEPPTSRPAPSQGR